MSVTVLNVEGLTVRRQHAPALSSVSFRVERGDYVGIVGPNGSGKTTLLKAVLGLVPVVAGRVEIFGARSPQSVDWRRVGYLPQGALVSQALPATVEEVVGCGLLAGKRFPRLLGRADRERVRRALAAVEMADMGKSSAARLSGGQMQRMLLARALAGEPDMLILDEPTLALDPVMRTHFHELVMRLNRERAVTVLLVSHDSSTIGEYANKLLYLDRRVVFFGTFAEFCRSEQMGRRFGEFAQHLICRQHAAGAEPGAPHA